jgi:hypothetical protein
MATASLVGYISSSESENEEKSSNEKKSKIKPTENTEKVSSLSILSSIKVDAAPLVLYSVSLFYLIVDLNRFKLIIYFI